jgi:hypothetical protein
MFGSSILDVGIGLALIFGFFALIVTTLRESIESLLKSRSRTLERAIREMLGPVATEDVYTHPLICGLYRGSYIPWSAKSDHPPARWWHWIRRWAWRGRPSYIPSRTFALAMLDVVGGLDQTPSAAGRIITARRNVAQSLRAEASVNGNANARAALGAIIDASGLNPDRTVAEIMDWYNGAMDRAAGRYKRLTGRIVFVISLAIVLWFNVDAITTAQTLYRDPAVRNAIVARAGSGQMSSTETLSSMQVQLRGMPLPFGQPRENSWTWSHAIGLLLSAFAISLGAPFWFDLLNKIMVIRSTVKPRDTSEDGGAGDRSGTLSAGPGVSGTATQRTGPVPGGFPAQQTPVGPAGVGRIG